MSGFAKEYITQLGCEKCLLSTAGDALSSITIAKLEGYINGFSIPSDKVEQIEVKPMSSGHLLLL
jgi:hypothetical protein